MRSLRKSKKPLTRSRVGGGSAAQRLAPVRMRAAVRLHRLDLQRQVPLTDHTKVNVALELGFHVVDIWATRPAGRARSSEDPTS
jgi:hypothetical protein